MGFNLYRRILSLEDIDTSKMTEHHDDVLVNEVRSMIRKSEQVGYRGCLDDGEFYDDAHGDDYIITAPGSAICPIVVSGDAPKILKYCRSQIPMCDWSLIADLTDKVEYDEFLNIAIQRNEDGGGILYTSNGMIARGDKEGFTKALLDVYANVRSLKGPNTAPRDIRGRRMEGVWERNPRYPDPKTGVLTESQAEHICRMIKRKRVFLGVLHLGVFSRAK